MKQDFRLIRMAENGNLNAPKEVVNRVKSLFSRCIRSLFNAAIITSLVRYLQPITHAKVFSIKGTGADSEW